MNIRRPNRLKNYDYSNCGAYHITICTTDRKKVFRKNGELTKFGKIAEDKIKVTAEKYKIVIDYFIIMPDHVHMLIEKYNVSDEERPAAGISDVVAYYKSNVTKECKKEAIAQGFDIDKLWQRSFYDHIIRNENDYYETINYIKYNDFK